MPPKTRSSRAAADWQDGVLPDSAATPVDIQQIAQLGSWELDVDDEAMRWSSEMFRILGVEEQSIEPSLDAFLGAIHPDDRAFVRRRFDETLREPQCLEFEYRVVRPTGAIRTVLSRAEFLPDRQPPRVIGTAQDVTEMRRFATSLTSQVEQLQQLTRASVAIYGAEGVEEILEVAAGHAMRIVGARRARGRIARAGSVLALAELSYDGELLEMPTDRLLAAVEPLDGPVRFPRPQSRLDQAADRIDEADLAVAARGWMVAPLVDVLGGASGTIELFEKLGGDFTESDEAVVAQIAQITSLAIQKAGLFDDLHVSEERYRRLFQAHLSGDFVVSPEGRFLDVNAALASILGYPSVEALKAVNIAEVYKNPREGDRLAERIRQEGQAIQYETELLRADGTAIFVIVNIVGVFDRSGELVALQGCLFDVTEWKNAEAALRESQQQLLQAQKMEAVGQLAGGIAHDFNNMLMAIQGFANLLEEELPAFGTAQSHLAEIRKASDRSARLTRQLLAYSRKQVLQPEVIDLNGVVVGMEDMLKRLIGEHIVYTHALDPRTGRVNADPGQLQQVLMNLVLNARDAMPEGGELSVRTQLTTLEDDWKLTGFTMPAGDYATLTVSDDGCGMPESVLSRIFEPFFTTKPVGSGSGLGLSTVYGIVKQSGGFILADSEIDVGTTFRIFLPRTSEEPAAPVVGEKAPETIDRMATVLVVEDEEVLRNLAATVLRRNGLRVLQAADGVEGMEIAQREDYRIDVLVTDLRMPRMGGEVLATRLWEAEPELKVVFMSGYAEEVVARQGTVEGAARFLEKPFSPHVLASTVLELLPAKKGAGHG